MNSMTDDGMYFFTEWIFVVVAFLTQETTEISFKSHFTYAPLFVWKTMDVLWFTKMHTFYSKTKFSNGKVKSSNKTVR